MHRVVGTAVRRVRAARGDGGHLHFWVIMTAHNAAQWVDKAILSLKHENGLDVIEGARS